MELMINDIYYFNDRLNIRFECPEQFKTIPRIDLMEYNGAIIDSFAKVNFTYGKATLSTHKIESGKYILKIRDAKEPDILKLDLA